jgi:lysosomal acid phosphatase
LHVYDVQTIDLGSLSQTGSVQMYNLGKSLRHRYLKLIPQNGFYTKKMIQVKSSHHDRTISSALSFLAGFMPPLEATNPLPINWQPIPVMPISRDRDTIIAQKRSCPKYDKIYQTIMNSERIQKINNDNKNLYKILSKNTGDNISSIADVELLHNTLEAEKHAGWSMPDWLEDTFPSKTLPLAEQYLQLLTETPLMKRIKAGPLLSEIVETMLGKKMKASERSITIYSGHDVTLVNVMNALDIINQTSAKPDYSAALAFELHQSLDHENLRVVKLYYFYDSDDKFPKVIDIPSCPNPCDFDKFSEAMKAFAIEDFDELCETA